MTCWYCCIYRYEPAGGAIVHGSRKQPAGKHDARPNGRSSEHHDVWDAGHPTGRVHVPVWRHERVAAGKHAPEQVGGFLRTGFKPCGSQLVLFHINEVKFDHVSLMFAEIIMNQNSCFL